MKIIQTLWLEYSHKPLENKGGWLSPEYHWIGWAYSIFQLRQFYSEVELYTNITGKQVLIDTFNLPYTKVHVVFDDYDIPPSVWALSKIITYNLQAECNPNEPFLHVDGDVFIWKPFEESLLKSEVIAQNKEVPFEFYQNHLTYIKENFEFLPVIFEGNSINSIPTYNAGIFGGNNTLFLKKYASLAIDFINKNREQVNKIQNSTEFSMLVEQWLFSKMILNDNINVGTFFSEPAVDVNYSNIDLNNFWLVPNELSYIHLMGMSKKNRLFLKKMTQKFKSEYPQKYYEILKTCVENDIELDFKVYSLSELNPSIQSIEYFLDLEKKFRVDGIFEPQNQWKYLYAKDALNHKRLTYFSQLSFENKLNQRFCRSKDFELIEYEETEESGYYQTLKFLDTFSTDWFEHEMSDLEMIIIDNLSETPQSIYTLIEDMKEYFDEEDYKENIAELQKIIIEKIITLQHVGAVVLQ